MDWRPRPNWTIHRRAFARSGVKVMITELDLNIAAGGDPISGGGSLDEFALRAELNPTPSGLPAGRAAAARQRYCRLFAVLVKHRDVVSRVTFWGRDGVEIGINNWP